MTFLLYSLTIILILLLLWILMLQSRNNNPSLNDIRAFDYAHRGLFNENTGIDENSLKAFRLATEKGFGSELDVHLTKDKQLVVMHDESLKRTVGIDRNISDCTLQELKNYKLKYSGEPIPTLQEVLDLVDGRVPLIIEIKTVKGNYATLTRAVIELLNNYKGVYSIESFDPRVLYWLKHNRPNIIRGQLSEKFLKDPSAVNPLLGFFLHNLLTNFLTKPDFIAYRVGHRDALSLKLARSIYGVQVIYWTVKSQELIRELKNEGSLVIFEYPNQRIKKEA